MKNVKTCYRHLGVLWLCYNLFGFLLRLPHKYKLRSYFCSITKTDDFFNTGMKMTSSLSVQDVRQVVPIEGLGADPKFVVTRYWYTLT